jgi:murein DD-endopeptidase MepM/ murein hydrolase activator NlpD
MLLNEEEILAQNQNTQPPRHGLMWPIVFAVLSFFSVVAAFGISPDATPEDIEIRHIVRDLVLPLQSAQTTFASRKFWREERIRRGDTVSTILVRLGVDDPEATKYLLQARGVRSLYQLIPGRTVRVVTTSRGRLEQLTYLNTDGKRLLVERTAEGFLASEKIPELEARIMQSSGVITNSLFGATDAAGLHENVAIQLADIFSSDIDFNRDLRTGDRFAVVYEANYAHGEFVGVGRVVTAEFTNKGRAYRAIYFHDQYGRGGYYAPDGKNVRKTFLRSPLVFSRITSRYSNSRFHPVLRKWVAHRGVDYGARTGTPVRATADGTVKHAGRKGGYGILVELRHTNGYSTRYAHMSGVAKDVRRGARVMQGQVIGYVGQTGLANGPHLHYEFLANSVQRNPAKLALPPGPPITPDVREEFEVTAASLLNRLDLLGDTNLALLD